MATQSFKDLLVWQSSKVLVVEVYSTFEHCKDYSFRDQIQRASLSIMNNIAEGYAKKSDRSFRNYLTIAKGSAAEVESMLLVAFDLKYVTKAQQADLIDRCDEISRMLMGFMKSLSRESKKI